jgi:hypothetical protein
VVPVVPVAVVAVWSTVTGTGAVGSLIAVSVVEAMGVLLAVDVNEADAVDRAE